MLDRATVDQQLTALFRSGQVGHAFQVANALVRQDPNHLLPWRILAQVHQFQGLWKDARNCVDHALRIAPEDPESILLSASVYGAMGRTADAIAACDQLLAADPHQAQAIVSKAGFLERVGSSQEAIDLIHKLSGPIPVGASITVARAQLRLDEPEAALKTIEQAFAAPDVQDRRRYHLFMTQARAFDRLTRYDEAFAAAAAGNALVARPEAEARRYVELADAVIKTFTAEAMGRFAVNQTNTDEHLFICGFPRSGTTLVEQILDVHRDVVGVGEAKEIDVFGRRMHQQISNAPAYPGCVGSLTEAMLKTVADAYRPAMLGMGFEDAPRFANKNLSNLLYVGLIAMIFPKARFVLTERDPRDVGISCFMGTFRAEAMPHLCDLSHLSESIRASQRLMNHWEAVMPSTTYRIAYEQMVGDQAATSRALLNACGLTWDDRCLRYFDSKRTVMTLAYDQVTRPIYGSSVGRYQHYRSHLGPLAGLAADS